MKHVKVFEHFSGRDSHPGLAAEDQKIWLDKCAASGWRLNPSTGSVDVDGDFDCTSQGLKDFKEVGFGHVKGNFYCDNNQLTSLEGAPRTVDGDFYCRSNQLTSLEGAPRTVGGSFDCRSNRLTTLDGAPQTVDGGFYSGDNNFNIEMY